MLTREQRCRSPFGRFLLQLYYIPIQCSTLQYSTLPTLSSSVPYPSFSVFFLWFQSYFLGIELGSGQVCSREQGKRASTFLLIPVDSYWVIEYMYLYLFWHFRDQIWKFPTGTDSRTGGRLVRRRSRLFLSVHTDVYLCITLCCTTRSHLV